MVSAYHDQLLPLFKYLNPHNLVNISWGLPIIRTSVDHGVSYESVKTYNSNYKSITNAINLALKISKLKCQKKV